MILAQCTFFLLISLAFGSLLRIKLSNGIRVIEKLIILILFIIGTLLIFNPYLLRYLSDLLKIRRGVDLLFYFYIVISTWFLLRTHIRANRIEKRLNKIVSTVTLHSKN